MFVHCERITARVCAYVWILSFQSLSGFLEFISGHRS
jgi:hypothetical protein